MPSNYHLVLIHFLSLALCKIKINFTVYTSLHGKDKITLHINNFFCQWWLKIKNYRVNLINIFFDTKWNLEISRCQPELF
uniref:Putative secreted protein n=1 Tax=Panstrongylus lignarius TaxID=156445 RepID=A0A224Y4K3_9HEMI